MDAERLRDLINRGMGNAARAIGEEYDVFRCQGKASPIAPGNRIMRIPMLFEADANKASRSRGFERAVPVMFDAINVRTGDYFSGRRGTFFVAAAEAPGRPLCVLTNNVVSVLRPGGASNFGLNSYGGVNEDAMELVLSEWPVFLGTDGRAQAGVLPVDGGRASVSVLLPRLPVAIAVSDLLQDRTGRRFIVQACSETEMGWLLTGAGTEV